MVVTISLANGHISYENKEVGLVDLGPCYGIAGYMTAEEAKVIASFVQSRSNWNLAQWLDTISREGWVSALLK